MAQSGIKKGFFFYFGLFVLLLISIFCICLVVMMFNPGSTVLWMQYFTDNSTIHIVETTDDVPRTINWKQDVQKLEISCNYANVVVERNSDPAIQQYSVKDANQDGIYIVNHAKGFAAASSAEHFSYQAYFKENGHLFVEIQEPTGFLYFSKEVKVVLHATTEKVVTNQGADWDFSNLDLEVKTKDGDVLIGGVKANNAEEIKPGSLDVTTTSGDISVSELANLSSLSSVNFQTEDGTLSSSKDVTYGGKTAKGLSLNCDGTFNINGRGKILYNVISAPGKKINLSCKSGSWDIDLLDAETISCNGCVDGNYLFGTIKGKISYLNSSNTLISPNIRIDTLDGDFDLEKGSRPNIEIKDAEGNVEVKTEHGSVKIGNAHKNVILNSSDDMKVDVVMAEDATGFVSVVNAKGDVRLGFLKNIPQTYQTNDSLDVAGVSVTTTSGNVTIDVTAQAKFVADMFLNDDKTRVEDAKITINVGKEMLEGNTKNPLKVNQSASGENGTMEIVTNGKIAFNLKTKEQF